VFLKSYEQWHSSVIWITIAVEVWNQRLWCMMTWRWRGAIVANSLTTNQ
jgi:hypothetical protein